MSIRSRINIPGGTCEFDLPSYFAWQQEPPAKRQADLQQWAATLVPLADALKVMLGLLRDAGHPHMVAAPCGQYQQTLKDNRSYLLLRLRIDPSLGLIPEISANRLMISIRLMRQDADGRLKIASDTDAGFELTLCA
jgi:cell division protein ZapD